MISLGVLSFKPAADETELRTEAAICEAMNKAIVLYRPIIINMEEGSFDHTTQFLWVLCCPPQLI